VHFWDLILLIFFLRPSYSSLENICVPISCIKTFNLLCLLTSCIVIIDKNGGVACRQMKYSYSTSISLIGQFFFVFRQMAGLISLYGGNFELCFIKVLCSWSADFKTYFYHNMHIRFSKMKPVQNISVSRQSLKTILN